MNCKKKKGEDWLQLFNVFTVRTATQFMNQTYDPRKHNLQFMMTGYRVNGGVGGCPKNVKYVFKGSQRTGLMINNKQKFMVNTRLRKSQPAGVNRNSSLMFSLAPCPTKMTSIDIYVQIFVLSLTQITQPFKYSMIKHLRSMSHQKKYGFPLLEVISNAGHGVGGGCMEHHSRSLNFTCADN